MNYKKNIFNLHFIPIVTFGMDLKIAKRNA